MNNPVWQPVALCCAALIGVAQGVSAQPTDTIIVMDGSGSMWGQIDGRPKLDIARETVRGVLGTVSPEQTLGLIAYGHREKGNCSDIELVVPPAPGTAAQISDAVGAMRFLGKTPLSDAVRQAADALRFGENAATVVLVTDGIETCDADPCALGRELEAAGLNFTAHVIGFGLTGAEGAQIACLATQTGGQYLQATDANGLAAALSATVTAVLPPPAPAPVPKPVPVLPTASLTAPDTAPAGSLLEVAFEGPHEDFDYIRLFDSAGDWVSEAAVGDAPTVSLRLPFATGAYEIVYLYRASDAIARRALTVTEAVVSLTAPDTAPAGSEISVQWSGPAAEFDYINMLDAAGLRVAEAAISDGNPLALRAPFAPGAYTLTYLFNNRDVIFSRAITLTPATVAITAPAVAQVGTDVTITWAGPNAPFDNIQLVGAGDGERLSYQYLGDTDSLTFTMPDEPGNYAFQYVFGDTTVIAVQPIAVTLEKAAITPPAADTGPVQVAVSIVTPPAYAGAPIQWSAAPLDPHSASPEALAFPDHQPQPWVVDLYPGRWRIYGEAPAGVTAGQGFAADITVTADAGQSYVIPLTPFETMGMGEDAPRADVGYTCDTPGGCTVTDAASGLGFVLSAGWFTDMPFYYETAGGARADLPTMAFMTDAGDRIELNPVRWIAANGPCRSTAAGQLCGWHDAGATALAAFDALAPTLTLVSAPRIPGITVDIAPDAAAALRTILTKGQ